MKPVLLAGSLALLFSCRTSYNGHSLGSLKNSLAPDKDVFVYSLPFETGKNVFLVQGYHSAFSHKGSFALDFKVRTGTRVCAARAGVVIATRGDSDRRGLKDENLADGNYIFIRHDDGSVAQYWHFKKNGVLVKDGDSVRAGQPIGLSGNTGYSAFPHLHFEVHGYDANGKFSDMPTPFYTQYGMEYLRPGRFYRTRR